jgi:hypothetical protein
LGRQKKWRATSPQFERSNRELCAGVASSPLSQASAFDTNRSIPNRWDRNLATSCPLTLFPAPSSGGAKVPSPPYPGETVTMPPLIPLLPGSPTGGPTRWCFRWLRPRTHRTARWVLWPTPDKPVNFCLPCWARIARMPQPPMPSPARGSADGRSIHTRIRLPHRSQTASAYVARAPARFRSGKIGPAEQRTQAPTPSNLFGMPASAEKRSELFTRSLLKP